MRPGRLGADQGEGWLRTFLELPGGVPSHDTFARVFARLDPAQLPACPLRWLDPARTDATWRDRVVPRCRASPPKP